MTTPKIKLLKALANDKVQKITSVVAPRATGILGAVLLLKGNKKTGERVDPSEYKTKEEYLIYLRQLFAYTIIKNKHEENILEIGCGEGYGANTLSKKRKVIGIDVDKEVVRNANKKYANSNLIFEHTNGSTLNFPDNYFDTVVSFQTIEHVKFPRLFLIEAHRVLKPKGKIFITTPNRMTRLKEGGKPFNRFHFKEYSAKQLGMLTENF